MIAKTRLAFCSILLLLAPQLEAKALSSHRLQRRQSATSVKTGAAVLGLLWARSKSQSELQDFSFKPLTVDGLLEQETDFFLESQIEEERAQRWKPLIEENDLTFLNIHQCPAAKKKTYKISDFQSLITKINNDYDRAIYVLESNLDSSTLQGIELTTDGNQPPPTPPPQPPKKNIPQDKIVIEDEDNDDKENDKEPSDPIEDVANCIINISTDSSSTTSSVMDIVIEHPDLQDYPNSGRYISIARTAFLRLAPDASLRRLPFDQSLLTTSSWTAPLEMDLARRSITRVHGLTWYTEGIINSCNIDNFLTYLCIRSSRQPGFARRYFMLNTPAEQSLERVFEAFAIEGGRTARPSLRIKELWMENLRHIPSNEGVYNLAGSSSYNLIPPLAHSSRIVQISVCQCTDDNQSHLPRVRTHPRSSISITSVDQIRSLRGNTGSVVESGHWIRQPGYAKCSDCKSSQDFLFTFVSEATWLVHFRVGIYTMLANFNTLPQTLDLNVIESPGQVARFELGLITLANEIRPVRGGNYLLHATSLQRFGNRWYYYNDMQNTGRLVLVEGDLLQFILNLNCIVSSIDYFRR